MNNINLEYPYVLLLIIPFILCEFFCKQNSASYYIPHLNIFNQSQKTNTIFITVLKYIIIISTIIALSSPYKKLQTINIKKDGLDIVLSLDTSGSMRQIGLNRDNIEQNRWQVVSSIVKEFIPKRINDNIAIVVFGTSVMTASPLSFDKKAQSKIIKHLDIGVAGDKTALIDSIAGSVNILKNSKAKSKVIIVLTDGEDTASIIPLQVVINLIKKHDIKIYAIGIGESNRYVLNKLANTNKGKAFFANSKDNLELIYKEINKLEKSKIEQNKIIVKEYLYFYCLFISIFAIILYIFYKNRNNN
jgi:Ca-activated chloride channel family protein